MTLFSDCSPEGAAFSLDRCTLSPDPRWLASSAVLLSLASWRGP